MPNKVSHHLMDDYHLDATWQTEFRNGLRIGSRFDLRVPRVKLLYHQALQGF